MFRKVLIANRGEIACRIAATLREMGIRSVAVYSAADRGALHVRTADQAHEIGAAEPQASYLNIEALIAAARASGAEAIHPGYGFLAENAEFASATEAAGLAFIGPAPDQIRALGDKREAREIAKRAGVPVVPGATGSSAAELSKAAAKLGFPLLVKAALGGGGKGMRVVGNAAALAEAIESATRVAASAFGDGAIYLERHIERPRHIEVQIVGDGVGGAIHLLERECSLQRRHQKVIEECPSPAVDNALRERLTSAAVALAKSVRYRGAGTVEFLLAPDGAFYFLEMNTRLQVEHPVTELVTGIDLVRLQIEIAAGGKLPGQSAIERRGHAIEARIYAEDAARGFLPQAGTLVRVRWPRAPFVRVDRGVESGDPVPVHYDPILAKVIAAGVNRDAALLRLSGALDDTLAHGVVTNLPFVRALVRSGEVARGAYDTEWIEREFLPDFTALVTAPAPEAALAAAALAELLRASLATDGAPGAAAAPDPFTALGRWRQGGPG
ncbi:MAG: ATP-grasp domain-containing protein [Candidatus Eisenbacteria bacterium]|nr:ATP-grasp domain-containing protein [Candidatus Eisenbacteria bacterium]